MIDLIPPYLLYPVTIVVSALISLYAVRKIIFITRHRQLFDVPDNIRKLHSAQTPSLGGIGIFAGYMVMSALFMFHDWYFIVAASVILFLTGIYDDIMNMRPSKKLLAQLFAAAIAVFLADVRITSLCGFAGIYELPYAVSASLTIICCTFFINVFNFMDGIDGLACLLAVLYTIIFGILFAIGGNTAVAGISLSLMGATIGLLYFNIAPARIYMGDTGSMMLGFTIFIFAVMTVNMASTDPNSLTLFVRSQHAIIPLILSVVFIPVYDALRVFILRASKGISPLRADRIHIHYYLLDAGFTHSHAVGFILASNISIIAVAWLFQDINPIMLIVIMTLVTSAIFYWVSVKRKKLKTTN